MLNIDINGNITVSRGDAFNVPLFIDTNADEFASTRFRLTSADVLYFGIMEPDAPFEMSLVKKMYTADDVNSNGDVIVSFSHDDTRCLMPGTYFYELKFVRTLESGGETVVATIVPRRKFVIQR